jgi:hypothetical protein
MKKVTGLLLPVFFLLSLLVACLQPPDYPIEPVIAFERMSKTQMLQTPLGNDSILVTFSFTDGDGDLGFENNQTPDIFISDGRDSFAKPPYRIPYVGEQGVGNGISGEISIAIPSTCCIYNPPGQIPLTCSEVPVAWDTVFYRIYIQDRAGHKSNEIETALIRLKCK